MNGDWRNSPEVQREIAEDRLFVDVVEHITRAMELRGVARSELANMCGVSRSEMSQRLSGSRNLTLKVVAGTLHELGFGLEVGLVDRQNKNRVERLRDYEGEWEFEHRGNVIDLDGYRTWSESVGVSDERPRVRVWG